ncbi:hypothetical protein [Virgibacillus proomii]|uniref:hypothetical protein n=1 Tax=Virgibacillus proomii TaxID=84407 RepID=UPI001C126A05|nr:hypothetical protein [Virgibacillus proomii]MBU5265731.1 hypothetical protein [Virgibacillus proomii]
MYCITKQHTHVGNLPPQTTLIKMDKDGNSSHLIDNEVVLIVQEDENKYEITCGNKLIAQGIYDNIFQTVDSLRRFGLPYPDVAIYTHEDEETGEKRRVRRKYSLFEEEIRPIIVKVGQLNGEKIEPKFTRLERPQYAQKDDGGQELDAENACGVGQQAATK